MWIPKEIAEQVDAVAFLRYIDANECAVWNQHRRMNEVRLFTGWMWAARVTRRKTVSFRQGFKSMAAAYRDAYYTLISNSPMPSVDRKPRGGRT